MYGRVKKLLIRNEQLSKLLQDAGIRVPSECGIVKKFRDGKKWAHKFTQEQAKLLAEKHESQSKYFCFYCFHLINRIIFRRK